MCHKRCILCGDWLLWDSPTPRAAHDLLTNPTRRIAADKPANKYHRGLECNWQASFGPHSDFYDSSCENMKKRTTKIMKSTGKDGN